MDVFGFEDEAVTDVGRELSVVLKGTERPLVVSRERGLRLEGYGERDGERRARRTRYVGEDDRLPRTTMGCLCSLCSVLKAW